MKSNQKINRKHLKSIAAIMMAVMLLPAVVWAQTLEKGTYTISNMVNHDNAVGQGMARSYTEELSDVEVTEGGTYVSLGFNNTQFMGDFTISVDGTKVNYETTSQGNNVKKLKFKVPSLNSSIKVGLYVVPMDTTVEYTVSLNKSSLKLVQKAETESAQSTTEVSQSQNATSSSNTNESSKNNTTSNTKVNSSSNLNTNTSIVAKQNINQETSNKPITESKANHSNQANVQAAPSQGAETEEMQQAAEKAQEESVEIEEAVVESEKTEAEEKSEEVPVEGAVQVEQEQDEASNETIAAIAEEVAATEETEETVEKSGKSGIALKVLLGSVVLAALAAGGIMYLKRK